MNTPYNIEDWANGTTRGRQVYNFNYQLFGSDIRGWNLLKVVPMHEDLDTIEKAYMWQSQGSRDEMIRVDITECNSWRQAQENLHDYLMECMRTDIPRGTKKLAKYGDIVYAAREPQTDIVGAITFTRGNLLISVSSSGEKTTDVSNVVSRLDRSLNYRLSKREVEKGKVRLLKPEVVTVRANEQFVLIKNLQETAQRGEWLKIIVPDGELDRKGDALIYVSVQGGEKQVNIYAISSD